MHGLFGEKSSSIYLPNKEDLPTVLFEIDKAIKGMKLQDKYTVLFLGIVDTKQMMLRYINASMPEPMILSRLSDSYRIKYLQSNASVIGIIDITDVQVAEQKLFRGLFIENKNFTFSR